MEGDRNQLVAKARLAEQAERYDDMADCMKKVNFLVVLIVNVIRIYNCSKCWKIAYFHIFYLSVSHSTVFNFAAKQNKHFRLLSCLGY